MIQNKGLKFIQEKDKRISWLSVFSSLCQKEPNNNTDVLVNKGIEIVARIYREYPLPDDTIIQRDGEKYKLTENERLPIPKGVRKADPEKGESPF